MRNRREHTRAKNVLSLWNPNRRKQTLPLGVFGYCVGRRIIHTTLKTGVRPQRKQDETREMTVLGTILLIILILILIGCRRGRIAPAGATIRPAASG